MEDKTKRICPKCGSKLGLWHFYNKYGKNGAFYCKKCKSIYRAIKDRKTRKLKVGELLEIR